MPDGVRWHALKLLWNLSNYFHLNTARDFYFNVNFKTTINFNVDASSQKHADFYTLSQVAENVLLEISQ